MVIDLEYAGVAQPVEQLICNQQVGGSSPSTSSIVGAGFVGSRFSARREGSFAAEKRKLNMGDFPSGQRGQTVNLLSVTSVVRIHHPPPKHKALEPQQVDGFLFCVFIV